MTLPLFDVTAAAPTAAASGIGTGLVDTAELRKARGAFFTPDPLCDYIADWAIRNAEDSILEPSCGEAAFLVAAARRLDRLGVAPRPGQLNGVELHAASSQSADALVRGTGHVASITTADFFDVRPERRHSAVIGNPPYVRYQDFNGENRAKARGAALAAGVPLTGLASSWAAFTVHAAEFLVPGGRLGLVLPAELLTVNYAAEVRRYLMQRFGRVRLVLFTSGCFRRCRKRSCFCSPRMHWRRAALHCELRQIRNAVDLADADGTVTTPSTGYRWTPRPTHGKWTQALLPEAALTAYTEVAENNQFTTLDFWGDTTLGMVTGNNRYFALSPARVAELKIPARELVPLSPPGSRHLRGLSFTASAWNELGAGGAATWLFRPPARLSECSVAARAYIRHGEETGVPKAYKCRVRTPWWRVPLVPPADLLLTYMNADTPRLTTNRARAHHLNSVHGVYLRAGRKALGADLLPLASLNTMTLLGAETVGRSYGGGMLKLEPKEADLLPVPAPEVLAASRDALTALRPQMAVALRNGRLTEAARLVDTVLLIGALGMSRRQVALLEQAHHDLTARRMARGRKRTTCVADTEAKRAAVKLADRAV